MGLQLRSRKEHWLWSRIFNRYWMTLGETIWYPESISNPHAPECWATLQHEMTHVIQQRNSWMRLWLWVFCYLFLPVPFLFAYFRWKVEREAYLVNVRQGRSVDSVVRALMTYGRPWPACLMRKWFNKNG